MTVPPRALLPGVALAAVGLLAAGGAGLAWYGLGRDAQAGGETGHRHTQSPAVGRPDVAGLRQVTREAVVPPAPAHEFRLVDRSGGAVALRDLAGTVALVSFTYTNCPEACPLLTADYLQLQERFASSLDRGDLRLAFITTDPDRDTPARLQDYTQGIGGRWLFLTGDLATLETVWDRFGIYREVRQEIQEIVVYHSYKTFLIDRQGRIRHRYVGVWQPADLIPDIESLLAPEPS